MKTKILFILHLPPPNHGASKVGEFISNSVKLKEEYDCRFIPIKSSDTIEDIGKINFKKLYLVIELYIKILIYLISFRPDKIYFTVSIKGVAFYRDLLLSTLWKCYKLFRKVDIYYHYHTKGLNKFVSISNIKLKLTKFFLKDVNIILLSPILKNDFRKIDNYKNILYLSNGAEDSLKNKCNFYTVLEKKHKNSKIEVLYLNHLIETKGFKETLNLAKEIPNIHFNFAGNFGNSKNKEYFFNYIEKNDLRNIQYHGFVNGEKKMKLLKKSKALIYLSKNDAFPLTLLEALSFGLPVFTTNEGSIPFIIDRNSGFIIQNLNTKKITKEFKLFIKKFLNKDTSKYCRKRYLENFTLDKFEKNLVEVLRQ